MDRASHLVDLTGSWTGQYAGRSFQLSITSHVGAKLTARLTIAMGSSQRSFDLTGSFKAGSGRIELRDARSKIELSGRIDGAQISGDRFRVGSSDKGRWTATR